MVNSSESGEPIRNSPAGIRTISIFTPPPKSTVSSFSGLFASPPAPASFGALPSSVGFGPLLQAVPAIAKSTSGRNHEVSHNVSSHKRSYWPGDAHAEPGLRMDPADWQKF